MTEQSTRRIRLGRLADDHVRDAWAARFPDHTLFADGYVYLPGGAKRSLRQHWNTLSGLDPYLACLRLALQTDLEADDYIYAAAPGQAQKPDLLDVDTRQVWEVKPDSRYGRCSGAPQMGRYLALLDTAEREYLALSRHPRYRSTLKAAPVADARAWQPGAAWTVPTLTTALDGQRVVIQFTFPQPGVILWDEV